MHYILLYIVYPLQVTWHPIVYNTVKQGLFLSNSGAVYACEQHSGVCVPRYKQGGGSLYQSQPLCPCITSCRQ